MILFMKAAGLVHDLLSVVVEKHSNSSIAQLRPIDVYEIFELATTLDSCVCSCLIPETPIIVPLDTLHAATIACRKLLEQLDCLDEDLEPQRCTSYYSEYYHAPWTRTAYLLDLVTILYCGGHTLSLSDSDIFPFRKEAVLSSRLHLPSGDLISMECFEGCLKDFWNGSKVWVLKPRNQSISYRQQLAEGDSTPIYYLETQMKTLSDTWGPSWAVNARKEDNGEKIQLYYIGNGSILPWKADSKSPKPPSGPRLCHWLPFYLLKETETAVSDLEQLSIQNEVEESISEFRHNLGQMLAWVKYAENNPLQDSDMLLIGAATSLQERKCECSTTELKKAFKLRGQIYPLKTRCILDISPKGQGNATTKRWPDVSLSPQEHRFYKQMLVETWELDTDECHPGDLQVLGGVLVSLCTQNAVRCSILSLIQTPSMRKWLQRFRCSIRGRRISV